MSNFNPQEPKQAVNHIFNPGIRGITTGKTRDDDGELSVLIQIGINEKKWYAFEDLELTEATGDDIEDLLRGSRFGNKNDLARILTFHKINSRLSNIFYSMQASRTDFYAHQFKPVYKFIESLNGRILIADEVGLGKTIEAGLIWQEIKARKADAKRLLVVCPPMLREKWKAELRTRFDTRAEIYDARGIISLLEDFRREGQSFQCAAVCSLSSIRQDSVQDVLEEFENASLHFDLVVIDESHHLRNISTKSHKVGKILSDLTESLVLLSATPIQLKDEDLFRQLNILDAEEFNDLSLLQKRLVENEPVIRAQSYLRQHPPDVSKAVEQIGLLRNYDWFRQSELLKMVERQLLSLSADDRQGLIEAGRRLEKLNLFSSAISRTRKREVQENRVLREARSLKLRFTPEEMEFYNSVTEAVQDRLASFSGNTVAGFGLMMPQRMMASSIPAMVEHYRSKAGWDDEVFDEIGGFDRTEDDLPEHGADWLGLEQIVNAWNTNLPDSKFDELLKALSRIFQREGDVKIIIFSFFKKTLAYLNRRLNDAGLNPLMIHGDIPMDERREIIDLFHDNPASRILLSSEVGSEGIDLQFCRIIINYDLPWNPMKVEQRIGRIDRLGQKSEKITILNLSVIDTIEEKILERLYNRIGIFERSLGDLEQILGEITEKLHIDLLSHRLTREEEDRRIEDTERAIQYRLQTENELVEQSAVFLGASEYILQQIKGARDQGQWITPADLSSFIQDFFDHNFRGTTVAWEKPSKGFVSIKLTNEARIQLKNFCNLQNPNLPTDLTNPGLEAKVLVYDPQLAQNSQKCELLNHFHAIVRWIADSHKNNEGAFFRTSAVEVINNQIPEGQYLVGVQFWTFNGIQRKVQVEYSIVPLNQETTISTELAGTLLQDVLKYGRSWEFASQAAGSENTLAAWKFCTGELKQRYNQAFDDFRQENTELKFRRQQHLESFSTRKQNQARSAIDTLQQKLSMATGTKERNRIQSQIKGHETRIVNLQTNLEDALEDLERKSRLQKDYEDIAAVICRVKNS